MSFTCNQKSVRLQDGRLDLPRRYDVRPGLSYQGGLILLCNTSPLLLDGLFTILLAIMLSRQINERCGLTPPWSNKSIKVNTVVSDTGRFSSSLYGLSSLSRGRSLVLLHASISHARHDGRRIAIMLVEVSWAIILASETKQIHHPSPGAW